ncbi:MAG: alpha/beta hydrolase, partial [Limisphaerales bacterium]
VGDQPSVVPMTNAVLASDGLPAFTMPFEYTQPPDTNTPYILYVHGWNMEMWEKNAFAESAFKRLYWQGYQGRFGSFRWPTTYHAPTGNTIVDDAALAAIYDPGEYNAWNSSDGLLNKLNDLNAEYPGHVYVLAHSMGNIVTGEALRKVAQQGLGQLVNTYVTTQAAVPGHCYDSTLSGSDLLDFGPAGFYGPTTANIYNNWLATNSAAAGTIVNFYNTNDYALNSIHWQLDEKLKPDSVIGIAPPYGYNGSPSDDPPLQDGFYCTYPPYVGPFQTVLYLGNANSVSNRYEITAFAAEPRSLAMGAINMAALSRSVDLETVWPPDTADPSQPFSEHFYHSAEFRGDYWQQQSYWSELLGSDAFNLK